MLRQEFWGIKKKTFCLNKWHRQHVRSIKTESNKEYATKNEVKKEKKFTLCTPLNNSLHLQHERCDQTFYLYNIHSTVFRLLKYLHSIKKKYQLYNNYDDSRKKKDQNKLERIIMCYVSIYKEVPPWIFLKITLTIFQFLYLNELIASDKYLLRIIFCKILFCRRDTKPEEKFLFYKYAFKILSALLSNSTFLGERFETIFFFKMLQAVEREDNRNVLDSAKTISFFLSCLSNYKRALKHNNLKNMEKAKCHIYLRNNHTIFLFYQQQMNTLLKVLPLLMNIMSKIAKYDNFNDIEVCNILDFLNEFKKTHTIQLDISKNIYKYFTVSSKIKILCLSLYFVSNNSNICAISANMYRYLYEIIFLKQTELKDLESLHFFMLAVVKNKRGKKEKLKWSWKQVDKTKRNKYCTSYKKEMRQSSKNSHWELCEKLKKKIIKRKKFRKERSMYFFIKQYFLQCLQFSKKQKKLQQKYLKSFSEFFSLYHLSKTKTRKKNYVSPLALILGHH